jgi:hypothetical protein
MEKFSHLRTTTSLIPGKDAVVRFEEETVWAQEQVLMLCPCQKSKRVPCNCKLALFPLLCISYNVSRSDIVTRGKYSVLHPNGSEWLKVGLIKSSRVSMVTLSAPPHSFKMCLRQAINNMRRDRISRVLSLYFTGGQRVLTEISGCFASSRPKRRIGV